MTQKIFIDKKKVYNIDDTPFTVRVDNYRFYFTSYFYMTNFEKRLDSKLKILHNRIKPYLPIPHETKVENLHILNAFNQYYNIEKRAYKVVDTITNEEVNSPEHLTLNVQVKL